jgi:hypothetical protein
MNLAMTRLSIVLPFLLLCFISACTPDTGYQTANGTWKSLGSGWILQISDSTQYAFYDITSISCQPNREGPFDELAGSLEVGGDTLQLKKGVITYTFNRMEKLPVPCVSGPAEGELQNPLYNFEVFATTLEEHYAFMDLNQVKWDSLYRAQRAKLTEHSEDTTLYLTIEQTLELLNDNHAYLEADDSVYKALEEGSQGVRSDSMEDGLPEIGDFQIADRVAAHHLEEDFTEDSWLIRWGRLFGDVGYIQVKAMWMYADLDVPEALIAEVGFVDAYVETFHTLYEGAYIRKEVEGVRKIMDRVMKDLSQMDAIVIDVRFNGGGQDAVSFEILSRFISGNPQVAAQKLRYKGGFTPPLPLYIQGAENAFTGPVYVLTSPQTGSAAEAFAIATLSIPNAWRIGSATSGAMSTALEKRLPNGWAFSISNEVYMDTKGNAYENIGVPPDYELEYARDRQTFFRAVAVDLDADKKDILKAIKALSE